MTVLQLALPPYRQAFVDALVEAAPDIEFLSGDAQFYAGVELGVTAQNVRRTGPNRYLVGRRFAIQRVSLRELMRARVLVVELNPRILNSWIALVLRRFVRRTTFVWGHLYPRAGAGSKTDVVRGIQRRLADGLILYTEEQARAARQVFPSRPIFIASNAIYPASIMHPTAEPAERISFLVIGRLVSDKEPLLALRAFARSRALAAGASMTIIGTGPLRQELEIEIDRLGVANSVVMAGEVNDVEQLRLLFGRAVATVIPGYGGLNITQSHGFGVPTIVGDNPRHAPEIEAVSASNSEFFDGNSAQSLAEAMDRLWSARKAWTSKAEQISAHARKMYSAEAMAAGFVAARDFGLSRLEESSNER